MTWFKVDDSFYDHPKIFDAPDCAVALWVRAGSWSARSLTDGFVPAKLPARLCDEPEEAVRELVERGLWEQAKGGYQFHDWDVYQPRREEVLAAKAKKSSGGKIGNHRRWHVERGVTDPACPFCSSEPPSDNRSDSDRSTEGVTESLANRPSRPVPSRPASDGGTPSAEGEGSQSVRARARVNEALRWLCSNYGLTDEEAVVAWEAAKARAKTEIEKPIPYLRRMAERGHLADIVDAIQTAGRQAPAAVPEPEPQSEATHLRVVPDVEPAPESVPPPAPAPARELPRDLGLPDDVVVAALAQLTMSGFPYQSAAARWFATNEPDATEAQVNAYALQLAWHTPKDRDVLGQSHDIAAALNQTA